MSRCPHLSSGSSAMGLAKRPTAENNGSAVKPHGLGTQPKKRVALADISNASLRKNSGKPSPSSIGTKRENLVISQLQFLSLFLSQSVSSFLSSYLVSTVIFFLDLVKI